MTPEQLDPSKLPVVQPPYSERLPVPVAKSRTTPWQLPLSRGAVVGILTSLTLFTVAALWGRFAKDQPSRSIASERVDLTRGGALSAAQLNDRIRSAILQTLSQKVVYADVLGEGPGQWDSRKRFPEDTVNCILWIQEVLALAYAPDDPVIAMDALRYYHGIPSFGMRKHFNAHWINVEEAPLHPLSTDTCTGWREDRVKFDFARFARSNQYECPLYRSDVQEVAFNYLPASDLVECVPQLEPGFYVLFGVASDRYEKKYGHKSGPMGLVHGILLEITLTGGAHVYHASTSAGAIRKERLASYTRRMQRDLHRGYTIYTLDPSWTPATDLQFTPDIQKIVACESGLPGRSPHANVFQIPLRD